MTNANTTLRTLFTYAVILPLALLLGYLAAKPENAKSFTYWFTVASIVLALTMPLLLKWHLPLLLLSWNATAVVFFLPGRPQLWLVMAFVSLGIALVQRALIGERRFIYAPSIVVPLILTLLVVLITAKLTGGFGVRA